jgi:hypothetical protein
VKHQEACGIKLRRYTADIYYRQFTQRHVEVQSLRQRTELPDKSGITYVLSSGMCLHYVLLLFMTCNEGVLHT